MPLSTDVLSGERADDGFYIPIMERIRRGVNKSALLFVGDCKMSALATSNSNFGLGRVSGLPIACDLAKVVILLHSGGSDDQPLTLRGSPGRSPTTGRAIARLS